MVEGPIEFGEKIALRFDVLTLFPEVLDSPLKASVVGRARDKGILSVHLHQIRDWAEDRHHVVDDTPYGGGGGMVMKPEPVTRAVREVRAMLGEASGGVPVIHLSPQGELLRAPLVDELALLPGMILLCGSYEGIDERAIEAVVDREISIGDYVLTGGELAALVLINAVARKIPGVLGNEDSAANDSFEKGVLDFPHFTRPAQFEGRGVPQVLLEGHHAKIQMWRRREALRRTALRRPDLIETAELTEEERRWLRELDEKERG